MFKHNKLRYWLGLPCVVYMKGMYCVSRRELLVNRVYLSESEFYWWLEEKWKYVAGYETPEEAYANYTLITDTHNKKKGFSKVKPV